ncbi:MAG: hypothetical protein ACRDY6_05700, partial [Acidimicrobiia bacterium]
TTSKVEGGDSGDTGDAPASTDSDNRSGDTGKATNRSTSGDTGKAVVASDRSRDSKAHKDDGDAVAYGVRDDLDLRHVSSTRRGEPTRTETQALIVAALTAILAAVLLARTRLLPGNMAQTRWNRR